VTSVVFVVNPLGQTSTKLVRITVVITSSPLVVAGTDTIGTWVVDTATGVEANTGVDASLVEGTAEIFGTVRAIVLGLVPQTVQTVEVTVIWKVIVEAVAVAGIVFVTSVVFVVRPVGQMSTKDVRITVVTTSSPDVALGAEMIGTETASVDATRVEVTEVETIGVEATGVEATGVEAIGVETTAEISELEGTETA